jgi:arylformamidase
MIDLTRTLENHMPVFPGHPSVCMTPYFLMEKDGRNVEKISMGVHTGTHVDTPYHFMDNGETSESISLNAICGPTVLLDMSEKSNIPLHIEDLESRRNPLRDTKKMVIQWGWSRTGSDYYENYPVLSPAVCQWLCDLGIEMIGMDTPSPGPPGQEGNEIHKLLLERGIYIIEGLTHLEQIETDIFFLVCLPLFVKGAGGAPCRAVALNAKDNFNLIL